MRPCLGKYCYELSHWQDKAIETGNFETKLLNAGC